MAGGRPYLTLESEQRHIALAHAINARLGIGGLYSRKKDEKGEIIETTTEDEASELIKVATIFEGYLQLTWGGETTDHILHTHHPEETTPKIDWSKGDEIPVPTPNAEVEREALEGPRD